MECTNEMKMTFNAGNQKQTFGELRKDLAAYAIHLIFPLHPLTRSLEHAALGRLITSS